MSNVLKIAYLCSADTFPGAEQRRSDAWEHDLTIGMLGMGLHQSGAERARALVPVRWDDPNVDFRQFEAAIVGTTWDYVDRAPEFLATLKRIEQHTALHNSPELIAWNMRKTYLRELADAGCDVIPTLWLEDADESKCRAAFAQFGCTEIVIKPQVGAGAWRQVKLSQDQAWPESALLPPGACMVQPFLPKVASEGEYSLLFFNGEFSHAVRKIAAAGDYRIQSTYGGIDEAHLPNTADLATASAVLAAIPARLGMPLYARVDMVRAEDGKLKLMELEAIEPYLYPVHAPQMGPQFAKAYLSKVRG